MRPLLPYRWTETALEQAQEIFDYLAMTRSERSVDRLRGELGRLVEDVRRFPGMFVRSERIKGAREIHLDRYVILYTVENDEILIVNMVHGMRDWVRPRD